jgi:hypothetical protein
MRTKRDPETGKHRSERKEGEARQRIEQAAAEDRALDAAVRRSISQYGP